MYVGSTLSYSIKINDEVVRRISKPSWTTTESEVAGRDPRHGRTGPDGDPQHPRNAVNHYGWATTGHSKDTSMALKAYNENTSEAPVNKSGKLRRRQPGQTNVEESSEDRLKNLLSQSHHRCQIQMRDIQISTVALVSAAAAAAVTASQRQRPIISNMSTMCQQAVWTPIGHFGHLRSDCGTRTAPTLVSPPISPAPRTTSTYLDRPTEPPPLPSSSLCCSSRGCGGTSASRLPDSVLTGSTIVGVNRIIAAAKSKSGTRKSRLSPSSPPPPPQPHIDIAQSSPTCAQCQRAFWTPIGLFWRLRSDYGTRTAPTLVSPPISPAPRTTSTNLDRPTEPPLPSSSSSSSSSSSTSATVASDILINTTNDHDTLASTNTTTTANTDYKVPVYTHPNYDPPFTPHIGLVGHLRIHRTETGEPVPGVTDLHPSHLPPLPTFHSHIY
ncbi:hypothetical protein SprV_1002896800 [Sparganum proliferum]